MPNVRHTLVKKNMSGTFSQMYIQLVMAVKNRESLIDPSWEEELYKSCTGIIQNKGQKLLAINGMPDHIHILIGMKPNCAISDLMRELKKSSNEFINSNNLSKSKFQWQGGYGAFSYSHSSLDNVINYINNQKEHHLIKTFRAEYTELLKTFRVEFNDPYLFEFIDELNT